MSVCRTFWFVCLASVLALGCGDDDVTEPDARNELEVITTLTVTFVPMSGDPVVAQVRDADGGGGMEPMQVDPILRANTMYAVEIELLNETVLPDNEDYQVGNEIRREAEEHQFFFEGTAITNTLLTYTYADKETDYGANTVGEDLPVGFRGIVTTGDAGIGTLRIALKHQPPVNDRPVKTATSTINDGESDVDITFNVTVQ